MNRLRLYLFSLLGLVCNAEIGALHHAEHYEDKSMGLNPTITFYSTNLTAPLMNIAEWDSRCDSDDYIFLTPRIGETGKTTLIVDQRGHLVWGTDPSILRNDLHVSKYKGEDHLVFWEQGDDTAGTITGCRMFNHHYEEVYSIKSVRDYPNRHVCELTIDDTAIVILYEKLTWNLLSYGMPEYGTIFDAVIQEINVESGELLFEWRATDHFSFSDMSLSKTEYKHGLGTEKKIWDPFHLNSVEKDVHGNYLISMRYLNGVAYICGKTGKILWQLGGKNNTFAPAPGTNPSVNDFVGQHDAHFVDPNHPDEITVFDNHGWNKEHKGPARGVKIRLDTTRMEATLIAEYKHPAGLLVQSQGALQVLPNGNSFIGWGYVGAYSEFTANGQILCDTHMAPILINDGKFEKSPHMQNYRATKQAWVGYPKYPPDIAIVDETLYVSWNGATEVHQWKLEGSETPDAAVAWIDIDRRTKTAYEISLPLVSDRFQAWRLTASDTDGENLGIWLIDQYDKLTTYSQPIKNPKHRSQYHIAPSRRFSFSNFLLPAIFFSMLGASIFIIYHLSLRRHKVNRGSQFGRRRTIQQIPAWLTRRWRRKEDIWCEHETKGLCDKSLNVESDETDSECAIR